MKKQIINNLMIWQRLWSDTCAQQTHDIDMQTSSLNEI